MDKHTDITWAREAVRAAIARTVRALQSEIELELALIKDAKARLGLKP